MYVSDEGCREQRPLKYLSKLMHLMPKLPFHYVHSIEYTLELSINKMQKFCKYYFHSDYVVTKVTKILYNKNLEPYNIAMIADGDLNKLIFKYLITKHCIYYIM